MITHRVFQLKLIGRHVASRRVVTFGSVDVLQKRLEASLCFLKGLILGEVNFRTQRVLDKAFRKRPLAVGCPEDDMTFVGPDIEQPPHVRIAAVLPRLPESFTDKRTD